MKTIEIRNGEKKIYDICLDNSYGHLREKLEELGVSGRKVCIVTDSQVAPLYLKEIANMCCGLASKVTHFVFEAGEASKNLTVIEKIYEKLIIEKFDRKDYIIALGGGVTGDMAGYAAATYLRGIDFIQLPTTLLSQVDSSIGGKTGVDFQQYKNMVGAFHQPALVYMNLNTLKTLDDRQVCAGMAEVIKHGLIKNRDYYEWIKAHAAMILERDYDTLEHMIYESCRIKGGVVERDPKEQGERALLNFGHTVGHSVEKLKDFEWLHGECVSLGMVAAAAISMHKGLISQEDCQDIKEALKAFHLPIRVDGLNPGDILAATKSDKKMDGGKVKFILLESPGNAFIDREVADNEILEGIGACL
ncbi:3-dehydroquinate synthase [Frisingicoccus sp.]|uniref:3-dehydroquinate synthase n=1 Tax=Frisingicoccus sp. TaxID=1918627 RepID=UPI0015A9618F